MSTARPTTDWPLILCGPMLRRVTRNQVCVFIALSKPARVRLRVFDQSNHELVDTSPHEHETLALGRYLHAVVAIHRPLGRLSLGQSYSYDLEIICRPETGGNEQTYGLANPGADPSLLDGPHNLGYTAGQRPRFALAASLKSLRLLHGSCRKAHGEGPDLLALVDDLVYTNRLTAARPHQLVLTGDQIYADDVALGLAQVIADTAPLLLTGDVAPTQPNVPTDPGHYHGELPDHAWTTPEPTGLGMNDDRVAPGERRRIATLPDGRCGFGVDGGAPGHLLYLGEFYAMYLLAWSEALWPVDSDGNPQLDADRDRLGSNEDQRKCHADDAAKQGPALVQFFGTLSKVRRALANIPTYMMFDDHEVSDDWNLNRHWRERVLGRTAGHQVIRNALLAYAVFQDWGNRPDEYAPGTRGGDLLETLRCPPHANGALHRPTALPPILSRGGDAQREQADRLLALDTPPSTGGNPSPTSRIDWHYAIAFDHHQLIALDTRTRRGFPGSERAPAQIIAPGQLDIQLDAPRLAHPDLQAIVVAPGPVFDVPMVEQLKAMVCLAPEVFTSGYETLPDEFADRETWAGDHPALAVLVDKLANFGRVLLLSGDVHYAFSNDTLVKRGPSGSVERSRIVQLCASAMRNEGTAPKMLAGINLAIPTLSGFIDVSGTLYPTLRHTLREVVESNAADGSVVADTLQRLWKTLLWLDQELVRQRQPRLPLELWEGECVSLSDVAAQFRSSITGAAAPPLRFRTRFALAEDDGYGPATITPAPPLPANTPNPPLSGQRHADGLIAINNLGLVEFASEPAAAPPASRPASVWHTLYWMAGDTSDATGQPWFTRHRVPLAPDPAPGD